MMIPFRVLLHYRTGLFILISIFILAVLFLEFQVQDIHDERDKQLRDALDNGHMRHLQKVPTPLVADELLQQKPMYPLIIYNRVPKTGSTSLTSLPYTLCETLRYHVLHICTVEHTQVLSVQDQVSFTDLDSRTLVITLSQNL
ncbi:heparan sulfate 2-O-sulfotransferase 1-like [Lytechinus variegatus]|uniref:heparan sulfate 2-O-sulfotransferase 1-like n=1 Tax=Lytechinus variegatus TaxID=7654 RepID=UPI001BB1CBD3|nr:heparan sulfate 2-O-sulfotransferase 1-like [Lytechinus variegatus]